MGNRTAYTATIGGSTTVTTYTYDAANRLTSVNDVVYTWDARGNLVHDGVFTYTYDAAGRMVRAESVTNTLVYTYNFQGLRVAQNIDGDELTFAWDLALGLAQVLATSDGTLNLYGLARIGEKRDAEWAYSLGDALNSVRQWADEDGDVTYAAGYRPFGVVLWEEGSSDSAWGFTGEWTDNYVNFVYLRARWYDPATGRFANRDPWRGHLQRPLTLNSYIYVLANPVNSVDPSGLQGSCSPICPERPPTPPPPETPPVPEPTPTPAPPGYGAWTPTLPPGIPTSPYVPVHIPYGCTPTPTPWPAHPHFGRLLTWRPIMVQSPEYAASMTYIRLPSSTGKYPSLHLVTYRSMMRVTFWYYQYGTVVEVTERYDARGMVWVQSFDQIFAKRTVWVETDEHILTGHRNLGEALGSRDETTVTPPMELELYWGRPHRIVMRITFSQAPNRIPIIGGVDSYYVEAPPIP